MEFTDVKAPEPVRGSPPWLDPQWTARRTPGSTRHASGPAASPPMSAFEPALCWPRRDPGRPVTEERRRPTAALPAWNHLTRARPGRCGATPLSQSLTAF